MKLILYFFLSLGTIFCSPAGDVPATPGPTPRGSCVMPQNSAQGVYTISGSPPGTFKPGDFVNPFDILVVTCNSGYTLSHPNKTQSLCSAGNWIPKPATCSRPQVSLPQPPTCTESAKAPARSCVMPENPPHGEYTISYSSPGTFKPGSFVNPVITLRTICNSPYKPSPANVIYSLCSNGNWIPEPATCSRLCPEVKSNAPTKIRCSYQGVTLENCNDPKEETVATISCDPFYEVASLSLNSYRICRDGTWDRPFPECYPICGQKIPEGVPTIIRGESVKVPWHVGVYDSRNKQQLCGGSLISERVVLSAAHCFTDLDDGAKYPKENYLIAAGKYYRVYDDPRDKLVQYSEIKDIHIPARYKGGDVFQYEADLAVVILAIKLTLTKAVQPVCVDWKTEFEYQQISENKLGVTVGWNQTVEGKDPSEVLQELEVPIISYDQCFEQVPKTFRKYLTHDKVCAGFLGNSTASCQGGSGGGLTFPNTMNGGKYYIRGIASVRPAMIERNCDQYSTFTLVSKYIDFIGLYAL